MGYETEKPTERYGLFSSLKQKDIVCRYIPDPRIFAFAYTCPSWYIS